MASLKKLGFKTALDVCAFYPPSDEAKACLKDDATPEAFIDTLKKAEQYIDALQFLAHALPAREAVWWACQCGREALGETPDQPQADALMAAAAWVYEPTEARSREAEAAAELAGYDNPGGLAAAAAFWSSDNIAPKEAPAIVPPPDGLTGKGVAGAVILAAVEAGGDKIAQKQLELLEKGLAIAAGKGLDQGDRVSKKSS